MNEGTDSDMSALSMGLTTHSEKKPPTAYTNCWKRTRCLSFYCLSILGQWVQGLCNKRVEWKAALNVKVLCNTQSVLCWTSWHSRTSFHSYAFIRMQATYSLTPLEMWERGDKQVTPMHSAQSQMVPLSSISRHPSKTSGCCLDS